MTEHALPVPAEGSCILWPSQMVLRTDVVEEPLVLEPVHESTGVSLQELVRSRREKAGRASSRKVQAVAKVAPTPNWPNRIALKERRAPRLLVPILR